MPKFFVSNNQIKDEQINIIGEDVNHIVNVLRLKINDKIEICDKDMGITYNSIILELSKHEVSCRILEKIEKTTESKVDVTIFQGLPKADKMEYIIQKCTELGVKTIIPVAMKRCIVKLDKKDEAKKIDRWQKIAEVASKQSGRDLIPAIKQVETIKQVKEEILKYDLVIIAYEEEKMATLKKELKNLKEKDIKNCTLKIGVVIGPEGGLDKEEVDELEKKGAKVITLGERILRTETAPIAILSNIMYEFEL